MTDATSRRAFGALLAASAVSLCFGPRAAAAATPLDGSGIEGGLVVHVGCGDARLTARLRAGGSFIVQGLARDAADVERARARIRAEGTYGPVSVRRLHGDTLPYIDNSVNALVVEDAAGIDRSEMLRVLVPGGKALVGRGGGWSTVTKPLSPERDEWTHYLHDADNNAVSTDRLVGPPRHMQFRTDLEWSRNHHKLASISAIVTAGGRLFYVMDSGPGADMSVPAKWWVVARDAYNSAFLWKRSIKSWTDHGRGFRSGPAQLPRMLVTDGERVYVPLGFDSPLVALDAASGETVREYEGTAGTEEILVCDGKLLVIAGSPSPTQAQKLLGAGNTMMKKLMAFDAAGGKPLWRKEGLDPKEFITCTLAASGGSAFYRHGTGVTCLDLGTGAEVWRNGKALAAPAKPGQGKKKRKKGGGTGNSSTGSTTLVVRDGVIVMSDGRKVTAMSARDGGELWSTGGRLGFRSPQDVFIIDGLVWLGSRFNEGRDLRTGEVKRRLDVLGDIQTAGHHHRCHREKATERYIMASHRGIEYMDLRGDDHARNNWIRGLCQYGVMPANGLTYAPSHSCGCYMEAKLFGFWAVSSRREPWEIDPRGSVLERGPAYGKVRRARAANRDEWPTLRHDARRSGATRAALPATLREKWRTELGGRLSAPVAAAGLVLVADVDGHTVHALDSGRGGLKWSYTTGGRVDSPPTVHEGAAIFGCRDGWVYCLRIADGELAWRFRAAPADMQAMDRDQLESLWPVFGSVLVQGGLVYCSAGRNSYMDEGLFMYALDPATGRVVHRRRMNTERPRILGKDEIAKLQEKYPEERISQNKTDYRTFISPDGSDGFSMAGNMNDVVVGDGTNVFLRHQTFDPDWRRSKKSVTHLFSTSSFTDGNENHRSHMVVGLGFFGRTIYAYPWIPGSFGPKLNFPVGLMFVHEGGEAWGIQRGKSYVYELFRKAIPQMSADDPKYKNDLIRTGGNWAWQTKPDMRPRAVMKAGDSIYLAGMPIKDPNDPYATFEGRKGGLVRIYSAADGRLTGEVALGSPPVWDGVAASAGRMYVSGMDGSVVCLGE